MSGRWYGVTVFAYEGEASVYGPFHSYDKAEAFKDKITAQVERKYPGLAGAEGIPMAMVIGIDPPLLRRAYDEWDLTGSPEQDEEDDTP